VLKAAAIFAVIAHFFGVLGIGGMAEFASGVAKILFLIAVIITVALAPLGFTVCRKVT
jgi:uncharacterized membrane protein YtjA (UPF0391 family)